MGRAVGALLLAASLLALARPAHARAKPPIQAEEEATPEAKLEERLRALMNGCRRCAWGVLVKELGSSRVLLSHNAELPFNPASNIKLVTAAATLSRLGAEHRFRTRLRGALEGSRVTGALYLEGGGDPTLDHGALAALAEELRARGVESIDGPLVLDLGLYKDSIDPPGYRRFKSTRPFRAGVEALSLHHNVVQITVSPGEKPGDRAIVALNAASSYFKLRTLAVTSAHRTRLRVATFVGGPGQTLITVSGRIGHCAEPRLYWRRVFHPARFTGHALLDELASRGISIRREVKLGATPAALPVLGELRSRRLGEVVYRGLKASTNTVAEQLLLALGADVFGAPATYAKGRRAVELYLRGLGLRPGSVYFENGSGLSRKSRMRPAEMVRVLEALSRDLELGPEALSALPLAGVDGTMRRRFSPESGALGLVRAKTGTLSGISALSGFAGHGERRLVFSFLTARVPKLPRVRRLHAAMAEALVEYLRGVRPPGEPGG